MDKIKLANGTIMSVSNIDSSDRALKISTTEFTVEELAEIFSNKDNTNYIVIMTASEKEVGFKTGFTSFAGIEYDAEGVKTIELFQPIDDMEARVSNVEGMANQTNNGLTDVELAVTELYEMMLGGTE